jgi:hypothetical protein
MQCCIALQHSCAASAAIAPAVCVQEIQDPDSAELGLTLYQLAATYYAHDLLTDAGPTLQRAAALLRGHYPEEHDLVRGEWLIVRKSATCWGIASCCNNRS